MTTIQVEDVAPFTVRILVNGEPVVFQPYNPAGGVPWVSKDEAELWALETAQANIDSGVWPPLAPDAP
jgi:hypothetical protein